MLPCQCCWLYICLFFIFIFLLFISLLYPMNTRCSSDLISKQVTIKVWCLTHLVFPTFFGKILQYGWCVFVSVRKSSHFYFSCVSVHGSLRSYTWLWCRWMLVHLQFPSFIFGTVVCIPNLGAAILASPSLTCFPVISCNLARGIRGWEIRAFLLFASPLSAHLLFSIQGFVEEEARQWDVQ